MVVASVTTVSKIFNRKKYKSNKLVIQSFVNSILYVLKSYLVIIKGLVHVLQTLSSHFKWKITLGHKASSYNTLGKQKVDHNNTHTVYRFDTKTTVSPL